jgi:hypothetical protein
VRTTNVCVCAVLVVCLGCVPGCLPWGWRSAICSVGPRVTDGSTQGFVSRVPRGHPQLSPKFTKPQTLAHPGSQTAHRQDPSRAGLADRLQWSVGLKTFPHPPIATTSVLGQVRPRGGGALHLDVVAPSR